MVRHMKNPVTGASIDVYGPTHMRLFAAFAQRGAVPKMIDNGLSALLAEKVAENPNIGISLIDGKLTTKKGKSIWTIRNGITKQWPSGSNGLRLSDDDKDVLREAIYKRMTMAKPSKRFTESQDEYERSARSQFLVNDAQAYHASGRKPLARLPVNTGVATHYSPDPAIRSSAGVPPVYLQAITENIKYAMDSAGRLLNEAAVDALNDAVFILYKLKSNALVPYKVEMSYKNHYRAGINVLYPDEALIHSRMIASRLILKAMCSHLATGCGNFNAVNNYVDKYLLPEKTPEVLAQHEVMTNRIRRMNGLGPKIAKGKKSPKSKALSPKKSMSVRRSSERSMSPVSSRRASGEFASQSPINGDYQTYRSDPYVGPAEAMDAYVATGYAGQSLAPVQAPLEPPTMSPVRMSAGAYPKQSMSPRRSSGAMSPRNTGSMSRGSQSPYMSRRSSGAMSPRRSSGAMSPRNTGSMSRGSQSPYMSRRSSGAMSPSMSPRSQSPYMSRRSTSDMASRRPTAMSPRRRSAGAMTGRGAGATSPRRSSGYQASNDFSDFSDYKAAVSQYANSRAFPEDQ